MAHKKTISKTKMLSVILLALHLQSNCFWEAMANSNSKEHEITYEKIFMRTKKHLGCEPNIYILKTKLKIAACWCQLVRILVDSIFTQANKRKKILIIPIFFIKYYQLKTLRIFGQCNLRPFRLLFSCTMHKLNI